MQAHDEISFDADPPIPPAPRTTAAGLEAWLSGMHDDEPLDHGEPEIVVSTGPTPTVASDPLEIGPVNAAEALALNTFSSPRKLTGPDGAELVVDPERNVYHFETTSLKPLAPLLQQPASAWTPVYSEAVHAARAANPAQPLERLRWYAGLIATPGILSRKLSRTERYKLSGWPETEREFPKHFRIAKAMLQDPATADEITAASGMPYEEVVDYINGCYAGGRLEAAAAAQDPETTPGPSRRERLFAVLNKPLFGR